jgi:2-amino-4-hydroxy-6-hydroxymethyldihydropteridine diphosphokinase
LPKLALISIGSNIDPENHLPLAAQKLKEIGSIIGFSTVYQNPAIGSTPQPDFLNAVAMIETDLTADAIRNTLRRIEVDLGRLRTEDKYAPRTIDLDLCLLGDHVLETSEFKLPDPDILSLAHLTVPMAELVPDYLHPVTGEALQAIADRLRPEAKLTSRLDIKMG